MNYHQGGEVGGDRGGDRGGEQSVVGIGEHAGSGVPQIFDVWKTESLKTPTIEESFGTEIGDRTKVTLPLVTKEPVSHPPVEGAKKGAKKGAKEEGINE